MDLLSNPKFAVAAFIFGFGFLIFVHEMGHFLVAKAVGIRATQFAIGFGHAILSFRKGMGLRIGGTEKAYCCLLYTSPSPRDQRGSRMPSSA